MGFNPGPVRRQDVDLWDVESYGWTTASVGAITTGGNATVTITVPGVTVGASQPWVVLAQWTSANLGNILFNAFASSANTVTVILHNNSGGTITPPANTVYGVIMGRLNQRVTQPNQPGGTSG